MLESLYSQFSAFLRMIEKEVPKMRATTRGLYALKAILTLAKTSDGQTPVSLHQIASFEGLSPEFLQQIFYRMRKAGIIQATRGPGGGFYLSKKPEEISVYEILLAAGETLEIVPCAPERSRCRACEQFSSCDAGKFWSKMEILIIEYARSKHLSDLMTAGGI
jgi:Rrf2 family iron-sulfur cluster assembly transcriptional regulator